MRNNLTLVLAGFLLLGIFESCKRSTSSKNFNQPDTSQNVQFISDESFAPILDQELYVFKSVQTHANPQVIYKSENDALRYLLNDTGATFAFLSRNLTPDELKTLKSHNLPAVVTKFAIDAVVLIVNEASADTIITVSEIKKMLTGQIKTNKNIVFDNPNSSLVRYLKDLTGAKELKQKNIYALKSNKEVIEYVSKHADAIGITGFSWLNDPDTDYADAAKKVKVVAVRDENSKDAPNQYFTPSQTTLSLKQYPLIRELYIVNCISSNKGTGAEFEHFLVSDRGQRVILRSGLLPAKMPGREIIIHSK